MWNSRQKDYIWQYFMSANFFNVNVLEKGFHCKLAEGMDVHILPAEQAIVSVVVTAPNTVGKIHSHWQ